MECWANGLSVFSDKVHGNGKWPGGGDGYCLSTVCVICWQPGSSSGKIASLWPWVSLSCVEDNNLAQWWDHLPWDEISPAKEQIRATESHSSYVWNVKQSNSEMHLTSSEMWNLTPFKCHIKYKLRVECVYHVAFLTEECQLAVPCPWL